MAGIYAGALDDALRLPRASSPDLWVVQPRTKGPFAEPSRIPSKAEIAVMVVVPETARYSAFAAPMLVVVAEAMVALVLANSVLEKFGGDSVSETARNLKSYLAAIPAVLSSTNSHA